MTTQGRQDTAAGVGYDPFAGAALARVVPTTEPQREVWLADRLGREGSLAYNESVSLRLRGVLNVEALRAALQDLVDRHEALRSTIGPDGEELCIAERIALDVPLADLSAMDAAAREATLAEARRRAVETPFDLEHGPLFRAELLRPAADEHVLILTAHHIVCDGWSFAVLVRDLASLYSGWAAGAPPALPPADSYADYALAQAALAATPQFAEDEHYWLQRFAGPLPVLDLPTDHPRPPRRTFASGREDLWLDAELVGALKRVGARRGASLFATLLSGFAVLLQRHTGQDDLVIGISAAGQSVGGHDALVGHCVNLLPLRTAADPAAGFDALLGTMKTTLLDAYEHQQYTFGTLLRKLACGRDPGRLPLVSVVFNIDQALDDASAGFAGLEMTFASNPRSYENFELFVNAVQVRGGVRLEAQYNRELFDAETVRRWLHAYATLLRGACAAPEARCGELPLMPPDELKATLARWNATQADFPLHRCLHAFIEDQVERTPHAVAVVDERGMLDYAALNAEANRLAHHLRTLGVGPDERVAICAERGREMVVGLLAILKAGGAYVPFDPGYPVDRLAGMLEDSTPRVLLVQQRFAALFPAEAGAQRVLLDAPTPAWADQPAGNPDAAAIGLTPRHLAYVIFTSGSTGRPKGAMNEHRGVVNRLLWMQQAYALGADDAVLQKTPFSFDVSVWEFFWPLMTGARLVMARPDGHKDPVYLTEVIRREGITTLHFVPPMLHAFLEHGDIAACTRLKRVVCSGEALPATLVERFKRQAPKVDLHNLYGPTEAAVDVTAWTCSADTGAASVPIGRPIANTRILILDGFGQPVPPGVAGEIHIGGVQVGRGYLNRPQLTAERFLPDPTGGEPGACLYRTGDLGRWRNDGAIEYLGRNDFQVKLRGFRIELGEIEAQLARQPAVANAAVIAREDRPGDKRLVAYVVARPGQPFDEAALRTALQRSLPDYMVPQHFVALDALPLLPNGKLDRKALPAPTVESGRSVEFVAPRDELERRIADEMAAVLALPELGVDDNFFELGGHSLLAAQLTGRLNKALGLALPLRTLFEAPTVARLAEAVRAASAEPADARRAARAIPRRADRSRAPLSLMQQRLWFLEELDPGRVVYNTPSAHRLTGPMDERAFERAFDMLVQRQPVLRTVIARENGEPVQSILPQLEVTLFPAEDLSALEPAAREAMLQRRIAELTAQPFELVGAPLFRTHMFRLGPEEHVLFFMIHHLIWDGWSFDVFYEEMAALYPAACENRAPELPALAVDYGDFAAWHREWMQGEELAAQLAHWRKLLADVPEPLELPADHPRPPHMSGVGRNAWIRVEKPAVDALRELARRADATLYMALLALYYVMLCRHTGQRDLVVGTPVRGRDAPELEPVMGFFVNALPLRAQVDPQASFLDLVRAVRAVVVDAFSYPDVPFEHLLRALQQPRDESRFPIYQALFSFQDIRKRPEQWGALRHGRVQVMQPGAAEDLGLWFVEMEQGLSGGLAYNTDILEAATVERMRDRYLALLHAALADPLHSVGRLALLPVAERRQLEAWNATAAPYPADALMHEAFEAQAARAPQRVAVRFGDRRLSYGDLEARANRIARALRARGVRRGALVGLCLQRGPDMLAALLGVLKSGAGYVPLDPAYPRERLAFMTEDAGLAELVTTSDLAALIDWPREHTLLLDGDIPDALPTSPLRRDDAAAVPDSIAYVIYTSGSTGKPKGVMVPHRAVVNFLASMQRTPGIGADDVLVAVTTLSFDIAVLELMLPLTVGAQVVLADRDTAMDGHALADLLEHTDATLMQATPSTWRALLDAGWLGDLAFTALCGGEPMSPGLAAQLRSRCKAAWNMYGPTETTVWSTCWRVEHPDEGISIGTPIANTQVWVLDEQRQPCPIGVPGEIWIGGDGVTLGYLNRAELTAERFVPDPFRDVPGARLYRTGDRGRWKADGTLEHLGRLDFQVKVRGYRIELGEIEAQLALQPGVARAIAITREDRPGDVRIVAYLVAQSATTLDEGELRRALRRVLPEYMVPQHFVALDALPLLPNGKLDRKALPAPADLAHDAGPHAGFVAPRSESEQRLASLWSELLGVPRVGAHDNFFDLGGHSMLAMQAIARMEQQTGRRINPRQYIFETLAQVAHAYDQAAPEPPPRPAGVLKRLFGGAREGA